MTDELARQFEEHLPPMKRAALDQVVGGLHQLERELREEVIAYQSVVAAWEARSGGKRDKTFPYPPWNDPVRPVPRTDTRVADRIHAAIDVVARGAYGTRLIGWASADPAVLPNASSNRLNATTDMKIAVSFPRGFCDEMYQPRKGEKLLCDLAWSMVPMYVENMEYSFNGPTRPSLLFDMTRGAFVVTDPWTWRRNAARRLGERLRPFMQQYLSGKWAGMPREDAEVTDVENVKTGTQARYYFRPREAVVAAHYQLTLGVYEWWTYDWSGARPADRKKYGDGEQFGDWWAPRSSGKRARDVLPKGQYAPWHEYA